MSASIERPSRAEEALKTLPDGLDSSETPSSTRTLSALQVGARLILRCRKDWRDATVVAVSLEHVTLSVCAPRGRTYRVKRSPDTIISEDGPVPVLGEGAWRSGLVRYDARW
ncbi:MAG: hypothetical protein H0W99_03480 [Acidobacteria bacterium]|nr:hypothetical protein [Acidobacteriota bacterium]